MSPTVFTYCSIYAVNTPVMSQLEGVTVVSDNHEHQTLCMITSFPSQVSFYRT